jgi:hypothetical protein
MEKITVDDGLYVEATYLREKDDLYAWKFRVFADGDVIVAVNEYFARVKEAEAAVHEFLNDTGPINADPTQVVWMYLC